jgi:predicted GIY-YIG superfamily endonuclease
MKMQERWLFEAPLTTTKPEHRRPRKIQNSKQPQNISLPPKAGEAKSIPLDNAPNVMRSKFWKMGIYVIERDSKQIYIGMSSNLAARISSHRNCLSHLRIPRKGYTVTVFHYPNATVQQLKAVERDYRKRFPGNFSHQNDTEFENLVW